MRRRKDGVPSGSGVRGGIIQVIVGANGLVVMTLSSEMKTGKEQSKMDHEKMRDEGKLEAKWM